MDKLLLIGGNSGIGKTLTACAKRDNYEVIVTTRDRVDIGRTETIENLGRQLSVLKPKVIVLNAYSRTINDVSKAFAQFNALKVLWPFVTELDTCFIVVSSTATYKAGPVIDPAYKLYIDSKQALNNFCINNGWRDTRNTKHKARMVLFEPGMMFNRKEKAKTLNAPVITEEQLWYTLKAAIILQYTFLRIGGQG